MNMFLRNAAEGFGVNATEEAVFEEVLLQLRREGVPVPHMTTTEEKRNYLFKLMREGNPLPEGVVRHLQSFSQPVW